MSILTTLFSLTGICDSIAVAGGAAVGLASASDIDLYICRSNEQLAKKVLEKLDVFQVPKEGYVGASSTIHLVGTGYASTIGLVQIMYCEEDTIEQVLETFDISTHQWAITAKGKSVRGSQATTPIEPPQIIRPNAKTLERYVKICRRYGHPIDKVHLKSKLGPGADDLIF